MRKRVSKFFLSFILQAVCGSTDQKSEKTLDGVVYLEWIRSREGIDTLTDTKIQQPTHICGLFSVIVGIIATLSLWVGWVGQSVRRLFTSSPYPF